MALTKQFQRELQKLFDRRTAWLHKAIGKTRYGPPPAYNAGRVKPAIEKMHDVAREILTRTQAQRDLDDDVREVRRWHPKKGKGHNREAKRKKFRLWYREEIVSPNCVYAFWKVKRCQYVGRTGSGGGRPDSHFEKHWFNGVTQLDIFIVKIKSALPRAECLATHLYDPVHRKAEVSNKKYAKKCPVCRGAREIRKELKSVFRVK